MKKVRDIISREIPTARVMETLELMMGPSKKDEKTKEEAVRTHWATDPVHATLHSYYKLASNLLDYHKTFKKGKNEGAATAKRPRKNSASTEGVPAIPVATLTQPSRGEKKPKRGGGGSHRDTRHWPPGPHHHQQDRGFGFTANRYGDRYEDRYAHGGRGGFGGGEDYYSAGFRGAATARPRGYRGRSGSRRFN